MPDYSRVIARRLSPPQRQLLVDHAAGPVPAAVNFMASSRRVLLRLDLVEPCVESGSAVSVRWPTARPRFHRLTAKGRAVAAAVLAAEAERLVALGCADPSVQTLSVVPDQRGDNSDDARVHSESREICDVATVS